jgi:hypothetical protein
LIPKYNLSGQLGQPDYSIEQASPKDVYILWILELNQELGLYSMMLTRSYMAGEENQEAHFRMISIARELWVQLFPKIQNTPLAKDFKKWLPFIVDPRLFLVDKYEGLLWLFEAHIRMALEHLNITKLA